MKGGTTLPYGLSRTRMPSNRSATAPSRLMGHIVGAGIYLLYAGAWLLLGITGFLRRAIGPRGQKATMLVSGRVNSLNWCRSHLLPAAEMGEIERLLVVMDGPIITHPKIVRCASIEGASGGLRRLLGRSVCLLRTAMREKPDVIVGFSFFPSALLAVVLSRFLGLKAIYQMTGGIAEIERGGISGDLPGGSVPPFYSGILRKLACRICRHFDAIIVRGERTREYLATHTRARHIAVITGSVDSRRFACFDQGQRDYDIVFVGRLAPVKQPHHVIEVIKRLAARQPGVRAAVVGDGPLMESTRQAAIENGLERNVDFLGHRDEVPEILQRSKVFLLTSKSEGLSIALAEAMTAGCVPVVADVGDLRDLVKNGLTGWLVPPGDFDAYASRIDELLGDEALRQTLSQNAREDALGLTALENVTARWESCLRTILHPATPPPAC